MMCIFYYFNRKTFLFQLQAKFKKLFQPETESNATVCVAAWIKKKLHFYSYPVFSHTPLLMNWKQN